jgi:hypothetical protein
MEEVKILKYEFAHTDEFGIETRLSKNVPVDIGVIESGAELLLNEFKNFLLALTYGSELVERIYIHEEE